MFNSAPKLTGPFTNKYNKPGEGVGDPQCTGKTEAQQHPGLPPLNPPAPAHVPATWGPERGQQPWGDAGHTQGAAHVSPSCSSSSSPALEPLPSASATSFPLTVLSWPCGSSSLLGRVRTGSVLSHMGQWQLMPWLPGHPAQLPLDAGPALGPLWLRVTCWGCSAVGAGTWLGTKGGSISGDPEPQQHRAWGHSSCLSPPNTSLPRAAWG